MTSSDQKGGSHRARSSRAKGQNGDVDANIYTVNVDGTGLTPVTHTGGSGAPDWGTHPLAG